MRADRLVAIVLLLQAHGRLTAGELAELLETSERTVRRDLDALLVAGVPLYAQRGRGGGWAIVGGHRLDLSGFTAEEARALFELGTGSGPGARSALRKVLAALPEPLRAQALAAQRSSHVDPGRWGRAAPADPPALGDLRRAVAAGCQADLEYEKPGGRPEWRRVHPYGLVAKAGVWYLLGGTDAGRRTFRVSRVRAVRRRDEPADVPEGFELAREWRQAEADFAARMAAVEVDLEVRDGAVLRVTSVLRGWTTLAEGGADRQGWRRLTVGFPHLAPAASTLAQFGGDVVVAAPDELRRRLADLGAELLRTYGPAGSELSGGAA